MSDETLVEFGVSENTVAEMKEGTVAFNMHTIGRFSLTDFWIGCFEWVRYIVVNPQLIKDTAGFECLREYIRFGYYDRSFDYEDAPTCLAGEQV